MNRKLCFIMPFEVVEVLVTAAVVGKQVNFGLEISMNDTNFTTFSSELIHCAHINLCHSIRLISEPN